MAYVALLLLAMALNVSAIVTGWSLILKNPDMIRDAIGNMRTTPKYLAFALTWVTTGKSTILGLLLLLVATPDMYVNRHWPIWIAYHALGSAVITVVHLFIAVVLKYLPDDQAFVRDRELRRGTATWPVSTSKLSLGGPGTA